MQQDVIQKIDRVEEKVRQLCQKMEYLKKENIMLIEENVKLKQEAEKIRNSGGGQRGRNQERPDTTHNNGVESEQIKKALDKYIVEVDKCIELINNM